VNSATLSLNWLRAEVAGSFAAGVGVEFGVGGFIAGASVSRSVLRLK